MGLQRLLLISLFMFSFLNYLSCYGNSEEDYPGTSTYPDEAYLYGIRAYPTYYGALDDGDVERQEPYRFIIDIFEQVSSSDSSQRVVNVMDFGAKGDGSDDTEAFQNAWEAACSSHASAVVVVPDNKNYLLKPITFSGPCKSTVSVMIKGTIEASSDRSDWDGKNRRHWILFDGIKNLLVGGGGIINGNGKIWWQNSCKINKSLPCIDAPTAMTFHSCNGLEVEDLIIKDSQQIHMAFEKCKNVRASNLTISAPEKSPNTDGIHVTRTSNIHITNCVIGTGDDCISIASGSQSVEATNIVCGPGHGISIGSLGAHNSKAHVSDVRIDTAEFKGTTNGVRIKTWQGGSGDAKNIVFQNVAMHNVKNPIIIDQNYCNSNKPCHQQKSAVKISDVMYKNIKGTSASEVAIKFDCSKSVPCHGIMLQDINLVREGGEDTTSLCEHVMWTNMGDVIPPPCI